MTEGSELRGLEATGELLGLALFLFGKQS